MLALPFLTFVAALEVCLVAIFIKFYYSVRNWPFAFAASAAIGAAIFGVVHAIP